MSHFLAAAIAIALGSLAVLHVYWAAGGKWGSESAVPERNGKPLFKPSAAACLAVAVALAVSGLVVIAQAFVLVGGVPGKLVRAGCIAVSVVFLLRAVGDFRYVGVFKRIRGTRFALMDTVLYSPLCLALGVGALAVSFRWLA